MNEGHAEVVEPVGQPGAVRFGVDGVLIEGKDERLGEVVSVACLAGHVLGLKEARDATNALDTDHRQAAQVNIKREGGDSYVTAGTAVVSGGDSRGGASGMGSGGGGSGSGGGGAGCGGGGTDERRHGRAQGAGRRERDALCTCRIDSVLERVVVGDLDGTVGRRVLCEVVVEVREAVHTLRLGKRHSRRHYSRRGT